MIEIKVDHSLKNSGRFLLYVYSRYEGYSVEDIVSSGNSFDELRVNLNEHRCNYRDTITLFDKVDDVVLTVGYSEDVITKDSIYFTALEECYNKVKNSGEQIDDVFSYDDGVESYPKDTTCSKEDCEKYIKDFFNVNGFPLNDLDYWDYVQSVRDKYSKQYGNFKEYSLNYVKSLVDTLVSKGIKVYEPCFVYEGSIRILGTVWASDLVDACDKAIKYKSINLKTLLDKDNLTICGCKIYPNKSELLKGEKLILDSLAKIDIFNRDK